MRYLFSLFIRVAGRDNVMRLEAIVRKAARKSEGLVRVTAWVPRAKLRRLMNESGRGGVTQSEALRMLIDNELERVRSRKAHDALYGIARPGDIDDRLL